jgi:flagellar motor switch protein FliN/FliY
VRDYDILYPGLSDVVAAVGRSLSVVGGRQVKARLAGVAATSALAARPLDGVRVGAAPGSVLELSPGTLGPLVDSFLGLPVRPAADRDLTASDLRLLGTHLLPALAPVLDAVAPDIAPRFTLTGQTGARAWAEVRAEQLIEVTIDLTVDQAPGSLRLVVPGSARTVSALHEPMVAACANVPATLTVTLPVTLVPAATMAALRPGDHLPLAPLTSTPWLLHAGGVLIAAGRLGHKDNRVAVTLDTTWRTTAMSTTPDLSTLAAPEAVPGDGSTPTAEALGAISAVQVEVSAQAGKATLPLAQLLALREGQVLTLDRAVDAPVDLLVNGHKVGTAEAVTVEGRMAVKILSLTSGE